jgi:hypothetical protein
MSTPVINAINKVSDATLNNLFQSVANNAAARENLSQSNRNIDAVSTNIKAIEGLNAKGEAVKLCLCRREGRDPANFADLDAVAADQGLMEDIGVREPSLRLATHAKKAEAAISQTDFALRAIICGTSGVDPTAFDSANALSQDSGAMSTISGSQTTMEAVATSQGAMQELAASQTAMQEIAASQTAMQEVAASQTAINVIGSNTNKDITENTVLNSSTATSEFKNSDLETSFARNFNNSKFDTGPITESRVLVTSNNNVGSLNAGISFVNDVGPETQDDTTFIINKASSNSGNSNGGGGVSIDGIVID